MQINSDAHRAGGATSAIEARPSLADAALRVPIVAVVPHKDETPGLTAEGFKGQEQEYVGNFQPTSTSAQPAAGHDKPFATLQARLALRGFALVRQGDGTLLIVRHGWPPRICSDLAEGTLFADRVGCPK